jgi:hypothetical protein
MSNEELLEQIVKLMETQNGHYVMLLEESTVKYKKLLEESTAKYEKLLEESTIKFEKLLEEHTVKINLKIENEVTKRIETLFDGYKLTHEKQWELERKLNALEKRIERLEGIA